jgi:hypothetical protein
LAPALNAAPGLGSDDENDASARAALVAFANGQLGAMNPQRQGLNSAILDGLSPLNVVNVAPGESTYSPLWDVRMAAWTPAATAMNDYLVLVRRDAREGQHIALRFDDVLHTSPAKWVAYDVVATARPNPWGELVFNAGWKPIGFAGSCWRVIVDGVDSGLVLEVRR